VAQALLPVEMYLDEAHAVEFVCVRDCVRSEVKGKELRVAGRQWSARKFTRSVTTCPPGAVAIGAVVGLAVFADAVSSENTQDHPVAVCWPAGGPFEIARGAGVMVEMHHDVKHVACNGLTCAALDVHKFVLVKDACEEGVYFLAGMS
jgi:hypothetical protein